MKLKITEAEKLANSVLSRLGFTLEEIGYISDNLIEAEKAGRNAHGLSKLPVMKKIIENPNDEGTKYFKNINLNKEEKLEDISISDNHLYIDAKFKTGYFAIGKTLKRSIPLALMTSVFAVGIKNLGFSSGYIGAYANKASANGLIFLGFHSSSGGLNYFGTKEDPLGTNPVTIAVPSENFNTISDVSMAALNWSDIEVAKQENKQLPLGSAIDNEGNDTTNPEEVFAVKSIAGYKGTALAYSVELLAGALTGSRVGFSQQGGWGSFFVLINPDYFVGLDKLKSTITTSNNSIKKLLADSKVLVPGEQSAIRKTRSEQSDNIEISDELYSVLIAMDK